MLTRDSYYGKKKASKSKTKRKSKKEDGGGKKDVTEVTSPTPSVSPAEPKRLFIPRKK